MKTIEKQAREYACDGVRPDSMECESCYSIYGKCNYEAFIAGAKAATRWIPVEEENPYSTKPVILYGTDRHGKAGYCVDYYYGPKFKLGDSYLYVSHWLPIPPMPGK